MYSHVVSRIIRNMDFGKLLSDVSNVPYVWSMEREFGYLATVMAEPVSSIITEEDDALFWTLRPI